LKIRVLLKEPGCDAVGSRLDVVGNNHLPSCTMVRPSDGSDAQNGMDRKHIINVVKTRMVYIAYLW
jgi:hypothetical protein